MLSTNPAAAEMAGPTGPDGPATLRHPSPVKTPAKTLLMTTITAGAVSSPGHQGPCLGRGCRAPPGWPRDRRWPSARTARPGQCQRPPRDATVPAYLHGNYRTN